MAPPAEVSRREFLQTVTAVVSTAALSQCAPPKPESLSFLLITGDDMSYDSLGVTGCRTPGVSPNIDKLASEGLLFQRAHVTVSTCQPSREVLMTGRYPHRCGATGFVPVRPDITTLAECLRAAGYINGILGKPEDLAPRSKFVWDTVVATDDLGVGRVPSLYKKPADEFFRKARDAGKPVFLMANSLDPHRPFPGEPDEIPRFAGRPPAVRRVYRAHEVDPPGFLFDLPVVREDYAQYLTAVHRCDETVGVVLAALAESGLANRTIVMFWSDNSASFPFAKTNCYRFSTRSPWIVRWPGMVKAGGVDGQHLISGVDFMPTVLDALGLPPVADLDGRSIVPLLLGRSQEGRDRVFTFMDRTSRGEEYPMRAVEERRYGYIFNAWANGRHVFVNEAQRGLAWRAVLEASRHDPKVAARLHFFLYRVPEELYDYDADPSALRNLVTERDHEDEVARMRRALVESMTATADPLLATYQQYLAKVGGGL